jgi:hypothetical protein
MKIMVSPQEDESINITPWPRRGPWRTWKRRIDPCRDGAEDQKEP